MLDLNSPLSEDELDRLADFLDSLPSPTAMNIERLDGFLCALVAGPDVVMLSEYWPKVIGIDSGDEPAFDTVEQAQDVMNLMMRHWNTIANTLCAGEVYLPILLVDETNQTRGTNWAKGFVDGMDMRPAGWGPLLKDEENGGIVLPVLALVHENHPDPELRYDTPTPEKREELLHLMTAYLVKIYKYFEYERTSAPALAPRPITRLSPKIGRNELCACGSGKKFKHCCLGRMH